MCTDNIWLRCGRFLWSLLVLLETPDTPLVGVVGFTPVFDVVDLTPQQTTFALAIVAKDLVIERLDELFNSVSFLRFDILPFPLDSLACCVPTTHAIKPAFQFAANLPEQIFLLNVQWA